MGFLKTLFERPEGGYAPTRILPIVGWSLFVVFLVIIGALISAQRAAAECCGGICGGCTVPVYIYQFTSDKNGYTYGDQAVLTWNSSGDYCILNGGNWSNAAVSAAGTLGVGLLSPGSWSISLQCVDTGGATSGVSGVSWVGLSVCPTGYTWNGSSCIPPSHPIESITIDCGAPNQDSCSGASNNHGTINPGDTLAVRSSYAAQPGDALISTAIVKSPANTGLSSPINPDTWGSVWRTQPAQGNGTYYFTPSASDASKSYYFYPVSATNFYSWDDHTPGSVAWITVSAGLTPSCSFNPTSAISVGPSTSFTLTWNPISNSTSASILLGAATQYTLTASERTSGGSHTFTSPSSPGSYTYTLRADNSTYGTSGACTKTVDVGYNVSISASPTGVTEGNSSIITFTRPDTAGSVTVNYNVNGSTATYTSDFTVANNTCTSYSFSNPTGVATIPSGSSSCSIKINTVSDSSTESGEYAKVTIGSVTGTYSVSSPNYQSVAINDAVATDICQSPITGTQTSPPSGCQWPSPSPGQCVPTGYTWNGSSCVAPSGTISIDSNNPSIAKGSSGNWIVQARNTGGTGVPLMWYYTIWNAGSPPSGVTIPGFSPTTCTPGTTLATCATNSLTVSSGATAGTYSGTVYYTDGTNSYSDPFSLTITSAASFAYTISANPTTVTLAPGDSTTVYIYATPVSGSGSVTSMTPSFPSGITVNPTPGSCTVTGGLCSAATVTVDPSVTPGSYVGSIYSFGTSGASNDTILQVLVNGAAGAGDLTVGIALDPVEGDAGEAGTGQGVGEFVLTRTGGANGLGLDLPVVYEISGSAAYGTDYTLDGDCLSVGSTGATIPSGAASCTIQVVPVEDTDQEGTKTITITPIPVTGGSNPN